MTDHLVKIVPTATGLDIEWPVLRIHAGISRIHSSTSGEVKAEVWLERLRQGEAPGHIEALSLNVLASSSKQSLAKKLDALCPLEMYETGWPALIEQIALAVLRRAREGNPVRNLTTREPAHPPEYLLDPYLLKGSQTILFGAGGTGKSYIALMLGITLALPYPENNLGMWPGESPKQVLYLDWEGTFDSLHWRLHKIQRGMGLREIDLKYRRCEMPLADELDAISSLIVRHDVKLVIVDSLGPATGGNLNANEGAMALFGGIRRLGEDVTTLMIAHTSKGAGEQNGGNKTVFGTVFFENLARKVYEIKAESEADQSYIDVAIYDKKRNEEAKQKPKGLSIEFGEETVTFTRKDVAEMPVLAETLSCPQRVLHYLKVNRKGTLTEMIEELGIEKSTLAPAVSRLKAGGRIVKLGDDYALAAL